jgi:hypothetical protein
MSLPLVHSVHFYQRDEALIARLHKIVSTAIASGNSAVIVASHEHRAQLASALGHSGSETGKAAEKRLLMFDAQESLDEFMVDGHPSDKRFLEFVGNMLKVAREAAPHERGGITVFGEMVAILWSEGNKVGALELERLWNDVLKDHAFHLHCAYPRWILQDGSDNLLLKSICDEHSSVLGHVQDLKLSA